MMPQNRPGTDEYAPYYGKYVEAVPSGDLLQSLRSQQNERNRLLSPLGDAQGDFRYAPAKWSIKETVGHVADAERIFAYRLLRIGRGDPTPLASFDQDGYVAGGNFSARTLASLLEEMSAVRESTIALVRSLGDRAWLRRGVASEKEVSALALAFIIAGHDLHHRKILEQRYLPALPRN
jgi:hypothetical protein